MLNLSHGSPIPRTQPLTEMLRKAHVVPEAEAGGCGCWQWLTAQPGCLAPRTKHAGFKERKVAWKGEGGCAGSLDVMVSNLRDVE